MMMGTNEILVQLRSSPVRELEISLLEQITDISKIGGQSADYCLSYVSNPDDFSEKQFLYHVPPEKMAKGGLLHREYNLNRLSASKIRADLPASEQLLVMNAALEQLAELDPTLVGEEGSEEIRISRLGGRVYDVNLFVQMYSFVKSEMNRRRM